MQGTLNFDDVTAGRHGGNEASIAANERANRGKGYWRAMVIGYASSGRRFTLKEVCAAFDRPLNALSGRLSELKRDGVLRDTGDRRDGCAVLQINEKMREAISK